MIAHVRNVFFLISHVLNLGLIQPVLCADNSLKAYRIYSINRPGRLIIFWTLREGAYSRLGAY